MLCSYSCYNYFSSVVVWRVKTWLTYSCKVNDYGITCFLDIFFRCAVVVACLHRQRPGVDGIAGLIRISVVMPCALPLQLLHSLH